MNKKYHKLAEYALKAKMNAYVPFSKFRVGAALLTLDNRIFTGCNVEISSFGLTICAERTAIFKAISEGAREFKAMAIISDDPRFTSPCGACRQVLIDLAGNIDFIMVNAKDQYKIVKLATLLPRAFTKKTLDQLSNLKN
jgi:cytidine deaminase